MPFITNPITGNVFDIPGPALHRDLIQLHRIRGDEWLHRELLNQAERGRAVEMGPGFTPQRPVRKRIRTEAIPDPVELPIIPETDEEGTKRLYKTRYSMLEKKYVDLHNRHTRTVDQLNASVEENGKNYEYITQLENEIATLRNLTVDSEAVMKRVNQIAAEIKLELPDNQYQPLSQRLEAFLGAIFCRVRVMEEEQDELAD